MLVSASCCALSAQHSIAYLSYEQARPVLEALNEPLPPATAWSQWISRADRATRSRLKEGDETSLVNLLLFGTSFTSEPRITSAQLDRAVIDRSLATRLADFERAIAAPGSNERLLFAREVLGEAVPVRTRLLPMLQRAIDESTRYSRMAEEAQALADPSLQFAERSRLYRDRGLSSDTSLRANFAIEQALSAVIPVLARGADPAEPPVRRVAVIGPGLDFADKQEGYDFYPIQTIQPFAIADSLTRLGLARVDTLTVTTLDLSSRVNAHIERAVRLARQGVPYVIHLPLEDAVSWTPEFVDYWNQFGDTIGRAVDPGLGRTPGSIQLRSVAVRPSLVERIVPRDVNISAQFVALPEAELFDLIVGTNVFVYYDRLQQGLALAGIARMLKPGGLLLSNNALVELPSNGLTSIGYSRTLYSDRDEDGDLIVWYQKSGR